MSGYKFSYGNLLNKSDSIVAIVAKYGSHKNHEEEHKRQEIKESGEKPNMPLNLHIADLGEFLRKIWHLLRLKLNH